MDSRAEGPGPVRAAHRTQLPEETAIGRTKGTQAQAQVLHVLYCSVLHSPVLYPYCAVLWRNVLYRHANLLYCTVLHCALLESTASKYTHFLPQISSNRFVFPLCLTRCRTFQLSRFGAGYLLGATELCSRYRYGLGRGTGHLFTLHLYVCV
jgi:hypothetical protein